MHIGISGNIGSGKTTLTEMLARHYGWEPHYEAVRQNPYMDDYYRDIERLSFAMEVFFLKERFKDMLQIARSSKTVVRTVPSMKECMSSRQTTMRRAISQSATSVLTWNFMR